MKSIVLLFMLVIPNLVLGYDPTASTRELQAKQETRVAAQEARTKEKTRRVTHYINRSNHVYTYEEERHDGHHRDREPSHWDYRSRWTD